MSLPSVVSVARQLERAGSTIRTHSDYIFAALRAGLESAGLPVGLAQAPGTFTLAGPTLVHSARLVSSILPRAPTVAWESRVAQQRRGLLP